MQYVREGGGWTRKSRLAYDFGAVPQAVDYALKRGLKDARVVVKAEAEGDDFVLQVVRHALLAGTHNDVSTILYRQAVLKDCLTLVPEHPGRIHRLAGGRCGCGPS